MSSWWNGTRRIYGLATTIIHVGLSDIKLFYSFQARVQIWSNRVKTYYSTTTFTKKLVYSLKKFPEKCTKLGDLKSYLGLRILRFENRLKFG